MSHTPATASRLLHENTSGIVLLASSGAWPLAGSAPLVPASPTGFSAAPGPPPAHRHRPATPSAPAAASRSLLTSISSSPEGGLGGEAPACAFLTWWPWSAMSSAPVAASCALLASICSAPEGGLLGGVLAWVLLTPLIFCMKDSQSVAIDRSRSCSLSPPPSACLWASFVRIALAISAMSDRCRPLAVTMRSKSSRFRPRAP
mmetsp:Transcript_76930/g.217632  ORF Transcript_76930/g.217632 Transcript_76930/m.217632 type:complete len:203 (+) Transcript_76930:120-728(+)